MIAWPSPVRVSLPEPGPFYSNTSSYSSKASALPPWSLRRAGRIRPQDAGVIRVPDPQDGCASLRDRASDLNSGLKKTSSRACKIVESPGRTTCLTWSDTLVHLRLQGYSISVSFRK